MSAKPQWRTEVRRQSVLTEEEWATPHLKHFFGDHLLPGLRDAELRVGVEKNLNDRRDRGAALQHLVGNSGRHSLGGVGFGSRWERLGSWEGVPASHFSHFLAV